MEPARAAQMTQGRDRKSLSCTRTPLWAWPIHAVAFASMAMMVMGPGACASSETTAHESSGVATVCQAPVAPAALCITTPASGAAASGTVSIVGVAGSQWVNVAAYDAGGTKVAVDVTPSSGKFTLALDTTHLPNGTDTVRIVAFSVPAGHPGGTSSTVSLTLDVTNCGTPAEPSGLCVSAPTDGTKVTGTVPVIGVAGTQWVNVAGYDAAGDKIAPDVTPSGGAFTLSLDTTRLTDGTHSVQITAFSVPAGQSGGTSLSVSLTLDVSNPSGEDGGQTSDGGGQPSGGSGKPIVGTNDGAGWGPAASATIVGGHVTWDRVEVGGGYSVAFSLGAGFHVLAIVNNPDDCTPLGQIDPTTWGHGVVSQIQANPGISLAEAGNEMYLKGTTGNGCQAGIGNSDPRAYGAIYLAGVNAMKAAGIHIPLLFNMTGDYYTGTQWSQDANNGGWLRDAVNANPGLAAAILANGVTSHPYGGVGENTADYSGTAAIAAQEGVCRVVLHGVPPFYITEFGYSIVSNCPATSDACSEQDQASKMQAAYDVFLSDPNVEGIWWYQSHDDSTGQWGYMNDDGSTRLSFPVLSAFAVSEGQ